MRNHKKNPGLRHCCRQTRIPGLLKLSARKIVWVSTQARPYRNLPLFTLIAAFNRGILFFFVRDSCYVFLCLYRVNG